MNRREGKTWTEHASGWDQTWVTSNGTLILTRSIVDDIPSSRTGVFMAREMLAVLEDTPHSGQTWRFNPNLDVDMDYFMKTGEVVREE